MRGKEHKDNEKANRNVRSWRHREWSLNDGQIPNFRGVRVASGTGYNRVEGNRRASRNGPVSDPPPETPDVTIRNFCIAVAHSMTRVVWARAGLSVTQRALNVTQRISQVAAQALGELLPAASAAQTNVGPSNGCAPWRPFAAVLLLGGDDALQQVMQ
jgi:hypothetical protein